MKPIVDLSADELRREIASRRYQVRREKDLLGNYIYRLVNKAGEIFATVPYPQSDPFGALYKAACKIESIPNWPADAGDAFELCADVAYRREWHLGLFRNMPHLVTVYFSDSSAELKLSAVAHGDEIDLPVLDEKVLYALALARLALAALRAQGGEDARSS